MLEPAECYGANIRFGTTTNVSPDAFSTDSENFNFLLSIEVTFGSRSDIFLKSSVRNFRNPLKIGSFVQEHSVNFGKYNIVKYFSTFKASYGYVPNRILGS